MVARRQGHGGVHTAMVRAGRVLAVCSHTGRGVGHVGPHYTELQGRLRLERCQSRPSAAVGEPGRHGHLGPGHLVHGRQRSVTLHYICKSENANRNPRLYQYFPYDFAHRRQRLISTAKRDLHLRHDSCHMAYGCRKIRTVSRGLRICHGQWLSDVRQQSYLSLTIERTVSVPSVV